jgi:hypothetical protein
MESKSLELPSEVLTIVFANLTEENILVCMCVCRSWHLVAIRLYYQHIYIDEMLSGNEISKIVHCLKSNSGFLASHFVKTICFGHKSARLFYKGIWFATKEQLSQLLDLCPNLQEITIRYDSILWRYLYEIPKITELRCIRKLYDLENQRLYKTPYYYQVMYQYRTSITDLVIHCSCDISSEEGFNSLFGYLSAFSKLQVLAITSGSRQDLIYFDQLLETCNQLTKLSYQLDHPFFQPNSLSTNSPTVWPLYPSMKELDIYLPNFDIQALCYLNRRFVNLKRLTLRLNQNDEDQCQRWHDSIVNNTVIAIHEFFQKDFINMIETLDYSHLLFKINGQSYLDELVFQFYQFKCNTKSTKTASYTLHTGRAERTQINLRKERKASGTQFLSIDYTFVRDLPSYSSESLTQYTLPYIQHLQSYGAHLTSLKITHSALEKREDASNVLLVLELCSHLEHLIIHVDLDHIFFETKLSYSSRLVMEQLCQNYHQTRRNSRLKSLTLSGTYIFTSLLETITFNNPSIERLVLSQCTMIYDEKQLVPDSSNNIMIHFDLHTLKLKSLVFDQGSFRTSTGAKTNAPSTTIYIVVEKEDGVCDYYLTKNQLKHVDGHYFEHVSRSFYEEQVLTDQTQTMVIRFTVSSLDTLELQNGRNKSFVRVFSFPDKTPMLYI